MTDEKQNIKNDMMMMTTTARSVVSASVAVAGGEGSNDAMSRMTGSTANGVLKKDNLNAAADDQETEGDGTQGRRLSDIDPVVLKIVQDRYAASLNSSGISVSTATTASSSTTEMVSPPPPGDLTRQVSLPGAFPVQPKTSRMSATSSITEAPTHITTCPPPGGEEDSVLSSSFSFHHDCSNSSQGNNICPTSTCSSSRRSATSARSTSAGSIRQESNSDFLSLPIAAEVVLEEEYPTYADMEAEIERRVEQEIIKRSNSDPDIALATCSTHSHGTIHSHSENLSNSASDHLYSMFGTNATWRNRGRRSRHHHQDDDDDDDTGSVVSFASQALSSTGSEDIRRITRVLKHAGSGITRNSVKGEDLQKLARKLRDAMKRGDSFVSTMGGDLSAPENKSCQHLRTSSGSSSGNHSSAKWKLLFCFANNNNKRRKQQQKRQEEEELHEFQFP